MKVFTVIEVAKICRVAPRTVRKWISDNRLKSYTTPGVEQELRIPREKLIEFLRRHNMPPLGGDSDTQKEEE